MKNDTIRYATIDDMVKLAVALRKDLKPGDEVEIILKKHQRTGILTRGIIDRLLTSKPKHTRGIKVRLTDGQVGRVDTKIS